MPTPVSAARLCLAADSAAALDAAVAVAHRRSHTQTTSLHVVFALLSSSSSSSPPPPSLLREALSRARSSAYSPRLQFKALDLCFSVALDRLPSSSGAAAAGTGGDQPPISNSLMAAIKRSQANQRRHPDTFHLYQQQQSAGNASPAFAGVKVELQQLVLAILDDPIVSRVFGEAGFRSCDIKLAVLRPPPPILRFPRAARCPPLFLCNFSTTEGFSFNFPAHLAADGGDENCRRIAEVMLRKSGAARNPMLVGVGAAEAARDFGRMVERGNWAGLPQDIRGVKFVSVERELGDGDKDVICARMEEVGRLGDEAGVVVSVGDLNGVVEGSEDAASCLVSELTKVLELRRGKLWVMGWSATYETYLKFLSLYPLVDKDWNLQLLPITSHRTGMAGLQPKPPSLLDSFVPFGGLFPQAYESINTLKTYQSVPRCQYCNEQYDKEVAVILKRSDTSVEDQTKEVLPPWMQKCDVVSIKGGFDLSKVEDRNILNANIKDVQKKWNEYCQHVHQRSQIVDTKTCQVLPHGPHLSIPCLSDTSMVVPKASSAVSQSISLPLSIEPAHSYLGSNHNEKHSISEPIFVGGSSLPHQPALSDPVIHGGHTSPHSSASVTTELALGTVHNYSFLDGKSAPEGPSQCSTPRKIDESNRSISKVQFFQAPSLPFQNSPVKSSYIKSLSLPSEKTWNAVSQRSQNTSNVVQEFDVSNCKEFYTSLVEKVGRQEEALWSISEVIIQCKSRNEKQQGPRVRGAIWLTILGPDRAGKKMAAMALAELIFGRREDLISIDLAFEADSVSDQQGLKNCSTGFWGKTMIDHIAMEISKKPLSVFLLENVDKADLLAQTSLSNAVRTGKFSDSHGREFSINSSIFVTTAKKSSARPLSSEKELNIYFSEERILAARSCQMKILIEPESKDFRYCPSSKVSVFSRQEPEKSSPSPSSTVFASKRKLDFTGKLKCQDEECSTLIKRPYRSSSHVVLDLNLPAEELNQHEEDNSSSETNSISENSQDWLDEFFDLMDKTVSFKPFDFDAVADYAVKEINRCFCNCTGSNCVLEIDAKVLEHILAATWLMRNRSDLREWIEQVLCRSLSELKLRNKLLDGTVVRLVAMEDLLMEEGNLGMFLPSRIILE